MAILDPAKNFAYATVLTGIAAGATSLTVSNTLGSRFPDPASGAYNLILWNKTDYANPSEDPSVEIVRATALSTDTFTITRAQEGTSDVAHNTVGKQYAVAMSWTKKMRDDVETYVNKQWKYLETVTFTAETGTKTTSTFANPSTAYQYKIVFDIQNNFAGTNQIGLQFNGVSGTAYTFGNVRAGALPATGGTAGVDRARIVDFGAVNEGACGEILVMGQKKSTINKISYSAQMSATTSTIAILNYGDVDIGATDTAVTNISFIAASGNITGTFRIYRLDI